MSVNQQRSVVQRRRIGRLPVSILFAVDYRDGDLDTQGDPTLVFRGATLAMLSKVFAFLVPEGGQGLARQWSMTYEHDCAYRNGHGYRRIAVRLTDYNYAFCDVASLVLLVDSVIHRLSPQAKVVYTDLDNFLNT